MASSMKSMAVRVLICLQVFLFMKATMADYDYDTTNYGTAKRFCGRHLSESLSVICGGEYEMLRPTKRSEETFNDYYNDQPTDNLDDLPLQYQTYAYLSKIVPDRARVRRTFYTRRGVHDECCLKPCSYFELEKYCKRKTN